MKRLVLAILILLLFFGIIMLIKRSVPYHDNADLRSADISIDSVWALGPAIAILDKSTGEYYWLKSYTSLDLSGFDTLKSKTLTIRYMKFINGPLENRIYRIQLDSVIIFDQLVKR